MEENKSNPIFLKIDQAVFDKIDKFKQTPNYNPVQDFYNGLEEEQQKVFKGVTILVIFLVPLLILGFMWRQNNKLKNDLALRTSIASKASQILGESQGLQELAPQVFSPNPIDSQSMMTSRLSGLLSTTGIDLSKIQVNDFKSDTISSGVMKSEAKFSFTNLSTDELMNMFMTLINRERFRVSSIEIVRNSDTNMLKGYFQAAHYSSFSTGQGEEE